MKFFLAILTVALVAQISFGFSIPRNKRDADQTSYKQMKDFMAVAMDTLGLILKDLPNTDAFETYRQQLKGILEKYETKNSDVFCSQKLSNIMDEIQAFVEKIDKRESEEAKQILEIVKKHKKKPTADSPKDLDNIADPIGSDALEYC